MGIEPMASFLPRMCATAAPHGPLNKLPVTWDGQGSGGQWRIRTSEACATDLQSVPFGHFGNCPYVKHPSSSE
jgi:hypothetical protein